MTAPAIFRQADLARALKAAKAAGVEVASFEITRDGRIIVRAKDDEKEPGGWGE